MRILRCVRSLDPATGGPTESIRQSSVTLAARGHDVEVITLDAPGSSSLAEFPATVRAVGPSRGSYGYAPCYVSWLQDRRRDYDGVIVHGLWQYTSFGAWRALHRTSTPYFVFPHGMLDPWFNRTYPLKHLKKILYWRWAEYRVLRDAAAVLFTSEEERRLARQSFTPYCCNEIVLDYGTAAPDVDLTTARGEFSGAFPGLHGKRFLLFLGRLHEKKGCDVLIEAFTKLADASLRLVIAGPAGDRKYLARLHQLARVRADAITFAGMLRGKLKWGALAAADAFVLPSHQENFGIAVAEALACGTPVLISNQVNIWRDVINEGAGFADDDNVIGITRLLQRWLETPSTERDRMRVAARHCFERRFEISRATDSLLSVLQKFAPSK
ncbi:MAG TPA: glycosyltransferase [Chthoniobacterales bacterium]|nr:glycosyltransferase [Chthoniobacterales bacterium]